MADGWLVIEMKQQDDPHLDAAWNQLIGYCVSLPRYCLPQYIIVLDMKTLEVMNREKPSEKITVSVEKLTTDIRHLIPVFEAVYERYKDMNDSEAAWVGDINWTASRKLAELHRHLRAASASEPFQPDTAIKYMTRFLFLMYAQSNGLLHAKEFLQFVIRLVRKLQIEFII